MITKGIITNIDYNTNVCQVRLPIFEQAGSTSAVINEATISTIPGLYNSYKINDIVYVAFEDNQLNSPVIIGKLYIDNATESTDPKGMLNCFSINAKELSIPLETKIIADKKSSKLLEGDINSYKTLSDIIAQLQKLSTEPSTTLYSADDEVVGTWLDGKKLYRRTIQIACTNYSANQEKSILDLNPDTVLIEPAHTFYKTTDGYSVNQGYTNNGEYFSVIYHTDNTDSKLITYGNGSEGRVVAIYVTIEYTKKTEE